MFLFHLLHLTRFQVLYVGTYGFFLAQNDILLIWKVSVYLGTVQNNQTISMEQSPSWETTFMEPKVHYHIHKSPPTALYLGAGAPFHLLKINFNIIFRSTHSCSEWSVSCGSPHLSLLNLIALKIFGERSRARSCSLSYFSILLLLPFCEPHISVLPFWRRNYYFLILAHPVYKVWIIQEPNMLELWNKLHFEQKKTESIYHV